MKKVSPSKLELISKCPAAPRLCEPFPLVTTKYSERGNLLHKITSEFLNQKEDLDDFDRLPEDDQKAVETCLEIAKKRQPAGKHETYIEHRMDCSMLGMGQGGKLDLGHYDYESGTVVVIDWKFGSTVIDNMKQLAAYGLALKEEIDPLPVNQLYLVAVQPASDKVEETLLIPKSEFAKWEYDIQNWVALAMNPKAKPLAGSWCTKCFCEAAKNPGACPAYDEMKGIQIEKKETQHKAEVSDAVSGFNPITVTAQMPALPLVVLDERTVAKAEDLKAKIQALVVVDQASADAMGLLLNESTTFERLVDENKGLVKRPFLDINKAIEEAAKKALIPLQEAKGEGKAKLNEWKSYEDSKNRAIEAEALKKRQEAERETIKAWERQRELQAQANQTKNQAERDRLAKEAEEQPH